MPYDDRAEKLEPELKVLHKRSMDHLKLFSASWGENRKLMYGKPSIGSAIQTKNGYAMAFGLFRSLVSNILVTTPDVFFETTKEELRQIALFLGDACSWDFHIGGFHGAMVKALWQTFPYGYGVIAEDMETKFLGEGQDRFIGEQRYFFKNHPPRDLGVDPDGFSIDLTDHRGLWIAYYRSVHDIHTALKAGEKKEHLYFNTDGIDEFPMANNQTLTDKDRYFKIGNILGSTGELPPKFRQLKIWRFYDRVNETISDVLDHDKRMILHDEWPMKIKIQGLLQFPVRLLAMNTESDDFYPTPEIELIKPQLKNLVSLNDQLMVDLTTKIRKYIGLSPYVDQAKMGKILDPKQPNTYEVTTNTDVLQAQANLPKVDSAADIIHKIPDIEPSQMLVPGMQQIEGQIQNVLAYGQANRGGLPAIRSAKEAARVSDAVQKSLLGRQSDLEKFTVACANYHVQLLKISTPPDSERYMRITDRLSAVGLWRKYNPKQIPDETDLFCFAYVGTSTPQTLDSKRAQFLQEMQIMAPIIEKNQLSLIPLLYRYGEVFSVKYMDSFLKNQKGAAMMLQAALVRAGQLGDQAPPDLTLKPMMDLIDSVLSPSEKQQVIEAAKMQGKAGGGQAPSAPGGDTPFKQAGNPAGAVDMGAPQ